MNQYATMIRNLKSPEVMERLMHLYGRRDGMLVEQTGRYIGLLKRHEELFHENREVLMISAPGRTEIGGNHTDHNRGRVLAAAINLDTLSAVALAFILGLCLSSMRGKQIGNSLYNGMAEFSKIMEKTLHTYNVPRSTGEPELIPLFAEDSPNKTS